MNKITSIIISSLLFVSSSFSQDEVAKQILDQLSEKSKNYTDITAEFTFNFSNSSQGIDENSVGENLDKRR